MFIGALYRDCSRQRSGGSAAPPMPAQRPRIDTCESASRGTLRGMHSPCSCASLFSIMCSPQPGGRAGNRFARPQSATRRWRVSACPRPSWWICTYST